MLGNHLHKRINYNGDVVFFEQDDYQDEDIRAMLASV